MKNVIAILVSLGAVLCCQVAYSQTVQTQIAEVKSQIAEALYSRNHAGKHIITHSKKNPSTISLNGKKYKKVSSQSVAYYKYDENGNEVQVTNKYGKVNTYVNGKDTVQAAVFPNSEVGEYSDLNKAKLLKAAPGSKTTTSVYYGKNPNGARFISAQSSPDGKSFYVNKVATDPQTGDTYTLRAKRNTTHAKSRTDIQGGTFQSVNHTDIRGTFGPSFQQPGSGLYGPETSYK